jgi:hypothetical protein
LARKRQGNKPRLRAYWGKKRGEIMSTKR